jgi:hypothetical protein
MPSTTMPRDFLHNHPRFGDLIRIVAEARRIVPALVEKDYWIMQSLYGLQQLGMTFQLKGGTSLAKGYGLIRRFSEDIDIRIEPPAEPAVMAGHNHDKPAQVESRRAFYDRLAQAIIIHGIQAVERDGSFDDTRRYRSAGIRLIYASINGSVPGLKEGILLEVGFDDVTPNFPRDISSWAYDYASTRVETDSRRLMRRRPHFTMRASRLSRRSRPSGCGRRNSNAPKVKRSPDALQVMRRSGFMLPAHAPALGRYG